MHEPLPAARKADILIDLESFGSPPSQSRRYHRRLERLFKGMAEKFGGYGLVIEDIWGVARAVRYRRGTLRLKVPVGQQGVISRIFAEHGGTMTWSWNVADAALIHEIEYRLGAALLPSVVILITSDGDFAGVAKKLVDKGHTVIVAGFNRSKKWQGVASLYLSLHDVIAPREELQKLQAAE